MRYPKSHKAETKLRIVETAARLFRKKGYDGIGIDSLMEEAGLTRGGFYSYFRSKRELLVAVMTHRHDFIERLRARTGTNRRKLAAQARQIAQDYVASENNKAVLGGCSLAALANDCSRADKSAQRHYAKAVRALAEELSEGLKDRQTLDARALQAVALCVGALLIQNAASADTELTVGVSEAAKSLLAELLGD